MMLKANSSGGPLIPNCSNKLSVPRQLLHHNTTTVNQILGLPGMFSTFTARNLRNLRILALTASSASIVAATISIFFLVNIDRRRRLFRHDLIFFLIICDLIKALVLMIYPLVILVRNDVYATPFFFNTLGWFTAYSVEGADLAIFIFSIHFALLIFKPSWRWRNKRSGNMEGGLYRFRAFIWPITALVPLLLATLAFVNYKEINEQMLVKETTVVLDNDNYHFKSYARLGGYKPYSAWCYLPPYPLWYKLVLSWGPRYFLIIFIFTLYISIYIFVRRESKRIKSQLVDFKHNNVGKNDKVPTTKLGAFMWGLKRYVGKPIMHFMENIKNFFSLSLEDSSDSSRGTSSGARSSTHSFFAGNQCILSHNRTHIARDIESQTTDSQSLNFVPGLLIDDGNHRLDNTETHGSEAGKKNRLLKSHAIKKPEVLHQGSNSNNYTYQTETDHFSRQPLPYLTENNASIVLNSSESSHDPINKMGKGSEGPKSAGAPPQNFLSPIQSLYPPHTVSNNDDSTSNASSRQNDSESFRQDPGSVLNDVKASFQMQTYTEMKKRRHQIQKNLRSIFIYPFSYIAIWIFPLIVDITQYNYEIIHGPIVWLIYIATIAQPLNGFVDTLVFLYREKPWRYSWRDIHTRELMETYMLKGEIGERGIYELYHSDLGKKGWYFRGRYKGKDCWKHKPQMWKRAAWYVYKYVIGVINNDYNYSDNCDDVAYWNNYYLGNKNTPNSNTSKGATDQKERQFSFPSDSTTTSDPFQNGTQPSILDDSAYVRISGFWRFIHLLPMLKGIDLDEIDRRLRLESKKEDFILPGLQLALNTSNGQAQGEPSDRLFKKNYSLSNRRNDEAQKSDTKSTGNAAPGSSATNNITLNINTDFSDVTRNFTSGAARNNTYNSSDEVEDSMGMLAFLKGSTT